MSQPTKEQLEALVGYASKRLGVPPAQLVDSVANGGYEGLVSSLSASGQKTLRELTGDPEKAKTLLASPQVQELLRRMGQ